ncbi:acyltransferase [Phormidium sp. LEGE 05292]|uniref:acyltransferase family protein n=1 Tax=[Phormidium] sp. LEGE 05292 TaxID=767427 RepID=UPI001881BF98|nr:acyltransferase [Phormidium sp. LEGE 05292]MBE9228818.1 acyltransferase [Phormidium sp. LEGE 05292]
MELSANSGDSYQNTEPEHLAKKEQKFAAFDFLRAIFSVVIVAYKTKIFNIPKILVPSSFAKAFSDYVLSGMVGALAVPVFLQVSLFLFYKKSEKIGLNYFIKKRLPRLIYLYLFWVGSITLFDILFVGGIETITGATSSIKAFLEFIVSGNSTPYFFFFSLIFVTVLGEILVLLLSKIEKPATKINLTYWLLFASCILVFSFSTVQPIIKNTGIQSSFLNFINNITGWDYTPVNFLPYVFTAAITVEEYKEGKLANITTFLKRKLYSLLGLTLFFFALEWILTSNGLLIQVDQAPLDHYLRLSLVFGSWLLLYLGIISKQQVPAIVKFLSYCSLGIYGFHVFFTFEKPLPLDSIPVLGNLLQAVPVLFILANFFLVLGGSIALTVLFKRIKILKQFV